MMRVLGLLMMLMQVAAVDVVRLVADRDARAGGILVAEAGGMLAAHDLSVVWVNPDGNPFMALQADEADAALVGDEVLAAWATGSRCVVLAITHGPGVRQMVMRDAGGVDRAALAELPMQRRPAWPGHPPAGIRLAASQQGLDAAIFSGRSGATLADFLVGDVALWPATWRERAQLAELGVRTRPVVTSTQGFELALVVSPTLWREHRDACERLSDAARSGWDQARQDPRLLVQALAAHAPGLAPGILLREAEAALAGLRQDVAPVRREVQDWADHFAAAGQSAVLPADTLATDVATTDTGAALPYGTLIVVLLVLIALVVMQSRIQGGETRDPKAAATQRHMLSDLPQLEGWDIGLHYRPHAEVSGDFYLCAQLADGRALVVVGDVSGHGVNAALVVAALHKAGELLAPRHASLHDWVVALDAAIAPDLPQGHFVTLVAVALDPVSGAVECTRAGHPPAWYLGEEDRQWSEIGPVGPAIGIGSRADFAERVATVNLHLQPGSELLLFTDGLTEIFDASGNEYGESGLRASAQRHRSRSAQEYVDALAADAIAHGHGPEDDLTALVVRRVSGTLRTRALPAPSSP